MDNEEKQNAARFGKNLDDMLNGQPAPESSGLSREDREVLDFTARIKKSRAEPSSAFQKELKARLLEKLAAQEQNKEPHYSLWDRMIGQLQVNPAARGIAIGMAVVLIGLLALWQYGVFSHRETPVVVAPPPVSTSSPILEAPPTGINEPVVVADISASIPKESFAPGENIEITLAFRNLTRSTIELENFPPEVSLISVASGETVRVFPPGLAARKIGPLAEIAYTLNWDQKTNRGPASPGRYMLTVSEISAGEGKTTAVSQLPVIVIQ